MRIVIDACDGGLFNWVLESHDSPDGFMIGSDESWPTEAEARRAAEGFQYAVTNAHIARGVRS